MPPAKAAVSASTSNGTPISFTMGDTSASKGANSLGANIDYSGMSTMRVGRTSRSHCTVQILREKPRTAAREVATFKLGGARRNRGAMMALLKRRACEAGANALLLKKSKKSTQASGYQIEAVALVLKSAKPSSESKPVPKTIEVPLPSAPVPKTITVDPDAGR